MTDENKQALEAINRFRSSIPLKKGDKDLIISAALQPKTSVDVEALKKDTVSHILKAEVEHSKALAYEQNFSFNKFQGELERAVKLVFNYLHSQGHLNQGWRGIESAPKDGYFLGWVEVAYGQQHMLNILVKDGSFYSIYDDGETLGHTPIDECYITHWMPLPAPPKENEDD